MIKAKERKLLLLPGDGIGPEIIKEAVKVCDSISKKFGHEIKWNYALVGAAAIDVTGNPYPEETHKICINACLLYTSPSPRDRG